MSHDARWRRQVSELVFPREGDNWLTLLRIGLGLQVCLYCLWLRSDWTFLLSGSGLIGRKVSEAVVRMDSGAVPTLSWIIEGAKSVGLAEPTSLLLCWLALLCAGIFLVVGLFTRASATAAWFLHLCAAKSGGLFAYGVDHFMTIGLFYLMLGPLPGRYSLDERLWRSTPPQPELFGFFRRVLQTHLCIAYFFSGLCKALGDGWWNGSNIWRAIVRPPVGIVPPDLLVSWKAVLPLVGICIVVIEMGYPLLMSWRRARRFWLSLVLALHVAISAAMGMHLFALVMIILNLAAFGPAPLKTPRTTVSG